MADLASVHGRVKLIERVVTPDEVGRSVADLRRKLVARVYRDGVPYGFWEQECHALQPRRPLGRNRAGTGFRMSACQLGCN